MNGKAEAQGLRSSSQAVTQPQHYNLSFSFFLPNSPLGGYFCFGFPVLIALLLNMQLKTVSY